MTANPTPSPSEGEPIDPRDAELTAADVDAEAQAAYPGDTPGSASLRIGFRHGFRTARVIRAARRAVERTGEGRGGVLYLRPEGDSFGEQQAHARRSELYRRGDMVLVWVNEGDLYGSRMVPCPEPPQAVPVEPFVAKGPPATDFPAPPTPPSAAGLREALTPWTLAELDAMHASADGDFEAALFEAWPSISRALAALSTAGTGEAADVGAVVRRALVGLAGTDALDPRVAQIIEEETATAVDALSTPAPTPSVSIGMSSVDFALTPALTGAGWGWLDRLEDEYARLPKGEWQAWPGRNHYQVKMHPPPNDTNGGVMALCATGDHAAVLTCAIADAFAHMPQLIAAARAAEAAGGTEGA